ncbi:MAG: Frag1/DRAM/Sfk1 family protein [Aliidiomarina sp.]|uniref:hypothetical protein n=1 Tax=Aliidiomarina sp. TaxID=1872439 RepID=UPI0025C2323E|nr:hypothetical protein [Aliidiomarina sp.]MCH8501560.1 Frag1/DRAM/Sfk1 family protein [Aliidiomarina sp.]
MQPKHLAWIVFIIPIIAVHGAYFIGLYQGVAHVCIPYLEGCTTISRAARMGDAIFLFRGLMMPLAMLLVLFWYLQSNWLQQLTGRSHKVIFLIGTIGALFLILYVNYLGTGGDFNRFMRRHGVIIYFAGTVLAQMLSINALHKCGGEAVSKLRKLMQVQLSFIVVCWLLAMISLAINTSGVIWASQGENIIEWFFALFMSLYFAVAARMWEQTRYTWQFSLQKN